MNLLTKEEKIKKFEVIQGGKDNSILPPNNNWLRDLPQHTVFLCQDKTDKIAVQLWFIVFKFEKAILLGSNVSGEQKCIINDEEFCKRVSLLEIIEFGEATVSEDKKSRLILPEKYNGDGTTS